MRRDSPLAKKKAVKPEDLIGVPLILSHQETAGNLLTERLYSSGKSSRFLGKRSKSFWNFRMGSSPREIDFCITKGPAVFSGAFS